MQQFCFTEQPRQVVLNRSVIISSYNRGLFLAKAIESIREQNYENWELVVVDDASQDNVTLDILDYYSSDERIHIHKLSHNYGNGIFAKNYALAHAKGDFVAILDDDDISYPNRLSVCVETFI